MPAKLERTLLAITSLTTLFLCLPWSGLALLLLLGFQDHTSDGTCYAGHPVYAVGQLLLAVPGLVVAARAGLGGLGAAAADDVNRGYHWKRLALAAACLAVWVFVIAGLEPGALKLPAARCAA